MGPPYLKGLMLFDDIDLPFRGVMKSSCQTSKVFLDGFFHGEFLLKESSSPLPRMQGRGLG
jgi:hypothetical protein